MISCIILAGGKGSRMQPEEPKESKITKLKKKLQKVKKGRGKKAEPKKVEMKEKKITKAFMPLAEKPLILHVFNTVKKFFPEIIVVVKTKSQQADMEKLVSSPKVKVVADNSKSFSPIIGIKAGLRESVGENVFVIGCDMPFVNGVTIFRLINRVKKNIDCIVPSKSVEGERKYEPLCAIYNRRVFDDCGPEDSLHDVIDKSKKLLIPVYNDDVFFNINTPEDLKSAEQMMAEKSDKK